jgi:hypothetical protein
MIQVMEGDTHLKTQREMPALLMASEVNPEIKLKNCNRPIKTGKGDFLCYSKSDGKSHSIEVKMFRFLGDPNRTVEEKTDLLNDKVSKFRKKGGAEYMLLDASEGSVEATRELITHLRDESTILDDGKVIILHQDDSSIMRGIADQSILIARPIEELVIAQLNSDISGRKTLLGMEKISSDPNLCYQYVPPNSVYSEERDEQFLG